MNMNGNQGTPVSASESREIDAMFKVYDDLHGEEVKRVTTAGKVHSRTTGKERVGRVRKRPVLLSHAERQRQKR